MPVKNKKAETVKICLNCGDEIEKQQNSTYCNKKCEAEHYKTRLKGKNNPNYKHAGYKVCKVCGKTYKTYIKTINHCSPRCYYDRNKVKFICSFCKKEFIAPKHKKKGFKNVFCNSVCQTKFVTQEGIITKKCEICGIEFFIRKSLSHQKLCSVKCLYKERSERLKGEGNPRWEGGITEKYRGFRGSDWPEQRRKAFERDDGACQRCGKQGDVAIHHIIPWKVSKNNELMNLICLCRKCHMTEENIYRRYKKPSMLIRRIMTTFNQNLKKKIIGE